MRSLNLIIIAVCACNAVVCLAEDNIIDSALSIPSITVSGERSDMFGTGNATQSIDTKTLEQNAAYSVEKLLSRYSPAFCNSYGYGALASPSIRGGAAAHTAVLWNGINIQNATDGGSDMSLLPAFFIDKMDISYGSSSALTGSGAVGGTVHINNALSFGKGTNIRLYESVGSFSNFNQGLSLTTSRKNYSGTLRYIYRYGKNNFKFENIEQFNSPTEFQRNAEVRQHALIQNNSFRITKNQIINTYFFYQGSSRQMPLKMSERVNDFMDSVGLPSMNNENYRLSAEWKVFRGKLSSSFRTAVLHNSLLYKLPLSHVYSDIRSTSSISEWNISYQLHPKIFINGGANNTFDAAYSDNYTDIPQRNRISGFASGRVDLDNNTVVALNIREEFIDNEFSPFIFSAAVQRAFGKQFMAYTKVSRNYRVPCINDLYWAQGGNPNLKPEDGLNEELGMQYSRTIKQISLQVKGSAYNSIINNYILWTPDSTQLWSPSNIEQVWSRGGDLFADARVKIGKTEYGISYSFAWIRSSYMHASDSAEKLQLMYVPKFKHTVTACVQYKRFTFTYNHSFVSKRYTSTDNVYFVKPYNVADVSVSYEMPLKKNMLTTSFDANNIFNTAYQVMPSYAMPLINFQLRLSLLFNI